MASGDSSSHPATALRTLAPLPAAEAARTSPGPRRRASDRRRAERPPFVIAHRGASGVLPEHTLPAFARAIALGADAVEVDVVATADGRLVARHEPELALSTDIAGRPELLAHIAGAEVDIDHPGDICTHDLMLRDLRRVRARQRVLDRPTEHDSLFMIPTLQQVLGLVRRSRTANDRVPAIHIELKEPTRHADLGLPLERELVRDLAAHGWNRPDAPVIVQSFEADSLLLLAGRSDLPLVQLARCDDRGIAHCTSRGLEAIATYAVGIGISQTLLEMLGPDVVAEAQARGLVVHVYTFADDDPLRPDPSAAYRTALDAGVDALISDFADTAVAARDAWMPAT